MGLPVVGGIVFGALVLAGWPGSAAAGGIGLYDPYPPAGLERQGLAGSERRIAAGVALRIPLGGGVRSDLEQARFAMGLALHSSPDTPFTRQAGFVRTRPLLELSVSLVEGPESVALNGLELTKLHRLYTQEESRENDREDGDDGVNWWWVAGGAVGGVLVAGIVTIAIAGDDIVPDFDFEEDQMSGQ